MQAKGALERLPEKECRLLMASVSFGRIIYTRQAMPTVDVVNFALDGDDIVISTDDDGKLAAATCGAVVAFEVDHIDTTAHTGWNVTAIGHSREVIGADEIARLAKSACSRGRRPSGSTSLRSRRG